MPELPEVESVRRYLECIIIGKKIDRVQVYCPKIIQNCAVESFTQKLQGQVFQAIRRRGKYLIFECSDYILLSHLRMEGKYLFHPRREIKKHEHVVFQMADMDLIYQDTRKFGTMHLFSKTVDVLTIPPLSLMGPEPFAEELTASYLYDALKNKKQAIKASLLEQKIICGLGNIYVDEVLFDAKIHPGQAGNTLSLDNLQELISSIQKIIARAIELGGTTIRSFTVHHDIHGRFQNELQIRSQEKCPVCKQQVKKMRIAGRTTYYCAVCQSVDKK